MNRPVNRPVKISPLTNEGQDESTLSQTRVKMNRPSIHPSIHLALTSKRFFLGGNSLAVFSPRTGAYTRIVQHFRNNLQHPDSFAPLNAAFRTEICSLSLSSRKSEKKREGLPRGRKIMRTCYWTSQTQKLKTLRHTPEKSS